MKEKSYSTINRKAKNWPSGEWDSEPDKVQWPDKNTGLPCLAVRHSRSGHWCGYVGLPPEHPLHGKHYEDVDADVHGGLTFSNSCQPRETEAEGICHVPEPGEPNHVWWFGFDCAHCDDYSPQDKAYEAERGHPFTIGHYQSYRNLAYVKKECRNLAKQLASHKHNTVSED